jgi:hypothetical protein
MQNFSRLRSAIAFTGSSSHNTATFIFHTTSRFVTGPEAIRSKDIPKRYAMNVNGDVEVNSHAV